MTELNWPFLKSRDLLIERTEGVYLYDDQGKQILDAAGGAIVSNVGHGRQRVIDAMMKAANETTYVVPPWITPGRRAMLDALSEWLPKGFTRIHGTSGGTEGNEAAMKIALHYQQAIGETERTRIIGRSVSYHGTSLATASISGHPARKIGLDNALPKFAEVQAPYPLRCTLGSFHENAGSYYADLLRDIIESEGPENVAAFLAEPITGSSGGAIVPPDDYWPQVRQICDEYGVLLIMDEVMTGFGRTGTDFGYQHWNITPDILVAGKGLAGGYAPLCGVFAQERIGAAIGDAGYPVMFNTFGAHPLACAAAAEVLTIMREENLVERAAKQGAYLHAKLEAAFSNHPQVAEIRGRGLLQAIEIVADRESLEKFPREAEVSSRVVAKALSAGVFFYGGGTGEVRDIVCMGPAFIVEDAQIDHMVEVLAECVDEVTASVLG